MFGDGKRETDHNLSTKHKQIHGEQCSEYLGNRFDLEIQFENLHIFFLWHLNSYPDIEGVSGRF